MGRRFPGALAIRAVISRNTIRIGGSQASNQTSLARGAETAGRRVPGPAVRVEGPRRAEGRLARSWWAVRTSRAAATVAVSGDATRRAVVAVVARLAQAGGRSQPVGLTVLAGRAQKALPKLQHPLRRTVIAGRARVLIGMLGPLRAVMSRRTVTRLGVVLTCEAPLIKITVETSRARAASCLPRLVLVRSRGTGHSLAATQRAVETNRARKSG
mmetsp:Transcript_138159/g.240205  ORF Transcript_138159/g.240205 Transcript_138159/m.240205 type:complete len:214 (+) Transcript_138159:2394-3035(+)